jgi:hypothetical protein
MIPRPASYKPGLGAPCSGDNAIGCTLGGMFLGPIVGAIIDTHHRIRGAAIGWVVGTLGAALLVKLSEPS